jgi:hypothetical protein
MNWGWNLSDLKVPYKATWIFDKKTVTNEGFMYTNDKGLLVVDVIKTETKQVYSPEKIKYA